MQKETDLQLPLEGWLRKRGEKGAIKAWKRRWFVLKSKKLYYYVSNTASTPKGFVDLLQTSRIFPFNSKRKDEFAFCIVALKEGREREYFLTTISEEERSYWVYGLTQVVRKLHEEFNRLAASGSFALPSSDTSTSTTTVPASSLSPRGPTRNIPSFYDYLSTPSGPNPASAVPHAHAAPPTSPPATPPRPYRGGASPTRQNQNLAELRSHIHERKPLPALPPARPPNPAPPIVRHFKSNSDDLSKSGSSLASTLETERSAKESSDVRAVAFDDRSIRAHYSPHKARQLNQSSPNIRNLDRSGAMMTPTRSARNLVEHDLPISFSPNPPPINDITSKLRVLPSYFMRGEEAIWGENYASRYTDWTEESRVSGCLVITNYQLIFVPDPAASSTEQDGTTDEIRVPLCSIIGVDVVNTTSENTENSSNGQNAYQKLVKKAMPSQLLQKKKKKKRYISSMSNISHFEHLADVSCKNVRTLRFGFGCFTDSRKQFIEAVRIHSPASVTALFAFAYRPPKEEKKHYCGHKGWGLYDAADEYKRLGIPCDHWRFTQVNKDYSFCKSYPKLLVVPAAVPDSMLQAVRDFRTSGRIPVVAWRHPTNGAVIVRCSQPRVGLTLQQNFEDEHLLKTIREACPRSETLYVFDARPKANAMANQAKGAGYERQDVYKNTRFKFLGIDNIHVVRESHRKLCEQCHPFNINEGESQSSWFSALTSWMSHLYTVLRGAVKVAATVHSLESSAVVHCSDGWDRTPQIVSLAEIILDPYYRTFTGFQILLEKEWLYFGHKFADRGAHYDTPHKSGKKRESSPIFHQFLECVWQLMQQYPHHFEFNDEFLIALSDHSHSGLYGTFLCNSQKQREEPTIALQLRTTSFWAHADANRSRYLNNRYSKSTEGVLPQYELCANYKRLVLWREYYFRYYPAMLPFSFM